MLDYSELEYYLLVKQTKKILYEFQFLKRSPFCDSPLSPKGCHFWQGSLVNWAKPEFHLTETRTDVSGNLPLSGRHLQVGARQINSNHEQGEQLLMVRNNVVKRVWEYSNPTIKKGVLILANILHKFLI